MITALDDGEPVPVCLPTSLTTLAGSVELMRQEWARGAEPEAARGRALRGAAESAKAYEEGVGFSGGVVVAQVRTTVTDLLRATGVEYAEAPRLVRRAIGWRGRAARRGPART
ncbi:hypothetical protein AB0M36_27695 [Actinoplanes sp. NPDC051346]|uniref:hypothetical protein n=1 Tax=Actinoplanes sp. NPDC051346 TaxID=3155048 RepID=UPI0034417DF5